MNRIFPSLFLSAQDPIDQLLSRNSIVPTWKKMANQIAPGQASWCDLGKDSKQICLPYWARQILLFWSKIFCKISLGEEGEHLSFANIVYFRPFSFAWLFSKEAFFIWFFNFFLIYLFFPAWGLGMFCWLAHPFSPRIPVSFPLVSVSPSVLTRKQVRRNCRQWEHFVCQVFCLTIGQTGPSTPGLLAVRAIPIPATALRLSHAHARSPSLLKGVGWVLTHGEEANCILWVSGSISCWCVWDFTEMQSPKCEGVMKREH